VDLPLIYWRGMRQKKDAPFVAAKSAANPLSANLFPFIRKFSGTFLVSEQQGFVRLAAHGGAGVTRTCNGQFYS
jgi:hypothetical protein